MPPLQQQTQKEKRQGRRTNPYRRPPRLTMVGSATNATFELMGSQYEWAQAQQIHSNTVENEWQNATSSENGDNTNDYDDNGQPSFKQVNETSELAIMVVNSDQNRKKADRKPKRGAGIIMEQEGNENKRRKITHDNDYNNTNLMINGNETTEVAPMNSIDMETIGIESFNANNVNTTTTTLTTVTPTTESNPTVTNTKVARNKARGSNSRSRGNKSRTRKVSSNTIRQNPTSTRKSRGKRGRPNVAISGASRSDNIRSSDQGEQHELTSSVSQLSVAPVPDVAEPEPRSTIVLRRFLESLCASEQVLNRERLLRLGTYLLDYFVSQAWCRPFVNPEDESAFFYRSVISRLMDLTTVEHNLWSGEYDGAISKFYDDIAQIMYNAFKFHPEGTIIFNEANSMLACFVEITTKFSKPPHDLNKFDDELAMVGSKLPHEEFSDVCGVAPNLESGSNVAKLPQAAAERLDPMSRPLFDVFERRNIPPVRFQPTEANCNFGRLYITMGAQNIKNCRDERNAILVIVKDVAYTRGTNRLRCSVIIAKPFGELRELDTIGFPELQDARYWTRVAFLSRVNLDIAVGSKFFDKYLRTPFKVSEYDKEIITPQQHEGFLAALNLRQEANRVNVPIESFESLGKSIQVDAEGFFKRVFHVPGDEQYVVQNFKEISNDTLETRIREAVCYDIEDELVGLSMVRYGYTLKEYAFNTRAPLTGEQKFKLIHDMIKGIKALHDAGFAHRDLSEVNMMVNCTTELLSDGNAKPELVIIDFGKAEFINRDDVLAWSVGEVTNDKLEHLPRIKTVPDHGYKLYREIVSDPVKIKFHTEKNVKGMRSRELLLKCITASPQDRCTAKELLDWLLQTKDELISEWAISGRKRIRKQF
ncbi:7717_t:CDS:2 [Funneliformis mosseae]|uniref:7717_t:CDS:1 n=1 Tax=Funneliformis mosseae TaxID=27381 RepID=A0A9N9GPI3_FUNMO|nr:7717_t:CDS:2 [Funneliformis mosseae]